MDLNNNLSNIFKEIQSIEDEGVRKILVESFSISLNILKNVVENGKRTDFDISDHITMVSEALNIDIEEVVKGIIDKQNQEYINSNKEADEETLDFITNNSDIDDYESFLNELNELKKEV